MSKVLIFRNLTAYVFLVGGALSVGHENYGFASLFFGLSALYVISALTTKDKR